MPSIKKWFFLLGTTLYANKTKRSNFMAPVGRADMVGKEKELPLMERIKFLRGEVEALFPGVYTDLAKEVGGIFRQRYVTFIFWYGQWDLNRDYSSAINASMAVGRLLTAVEMLAIVPEFREDRDIKRIIDTTNKIGSTCWNNIQEAAGRIIPFE